MGVTIFLLLTFVLIFTKIGKNISKKESDESSFEEFFTQEQSYEEESDFVDIGKKTTVTRDVKEEPAESCSRKNIIKDVEKKENDFSLRDAVIYSSILERPYK
ncbi:MAG: hypothetical protein J6P97_03025 [Bacteroidales bacterium]|nr:hypothetical protein [Bacteroidales bacterium]